MMKFRILGPLEVRAGEGWTAIGAPKWRSALACLLLNAGRTVSTDALIGELWQDSPPARAANLVSIYMLRLRRLIGDAEGRVIVTRAPGYRLRLDHGDLDAQRFETLVSQGRQALAGIPGAGGAGEAGSGGPRRPAEAAGARRAGGSEPGRAAELLTQALDLWRGTALADVPPSPLVEAEAERLEELRLAATELRIQADLACGRYESLVPELRRLLASHPLREGLWLSLMRALDGAGRHAEALDAYGQARSVIAGQLGVDPGRELRELFQRMLSADAQHRPAEPAAPGSITLGAVPPPGVPGDEGLPPGAATAGAAPGGAVPAGPGRAGGQAGPGEPGEREGREGPVPMQLPADIADFTGRDEHVARVCAMLSAGPPDGNPGAVPLALVAGAGGLGKTALAVHAAHRLRAGYPDGQLYVDLLGASPRPHEPADVLARFLRDLGVDGSRIPPGVDERAALYRTRLSGQRMLVVLDNAAGAAQVRPLLPGSASCAVLVTSRNRMPDLVGSSLVDLDVLDDSEALTLLRRIIGAQRAAAEPAATAELLVACAGLPLAIRICAARLAARSSWTIQALASRLADERRRLDELKVGDLAVRASFEVSFASLPAPARSDQADPARAFRLLGLWQGPSIGLGAAAALLGQPEDWVADALEILVDAHLLESPAPDRYRFHDLLRVYAADRARAEEGEQERAGAVRRVLTWYLHAAEAAARVISPYHRRVPLGDAPAWLRPVEFGSLDEALAWCEAERHCLVAATRQAAECGEHEIAWKLPAAAMSFFYRRSHWADWTATHQAGLASARTLGDRLAEAWILNNLGMAYGQQRMKEAVGCFEQALALCKKLGDTQGEARAANNVANAYFDLGRFTEALDAARRSLAIQRQAGNRYGEGFALNTLGCACRELCRIDEAAEFLQQALSTFRALGDQAAQADSLGDLGGTYLKGERLEDALSCLRESLGIWQSVGDRHGEAATLKRLGLAVGRSGKPAEARELLSGALLLFERLGDHAEASETRAVLAELGEPAR
ncbi:MAG TPA: BTAD domain-containing putative transcriptional regulator [Streptosporangiaceae bacterium]|nr:BTAD domain-containing putative transcriptional regulator [Streptosporangiaceae bacterium]